MNDIDPFSCTHVIYSFAGLDKETLTIISLDKEEDLIKGKKDTPETSNHVLHFLSLFLSLLTFLLPYSNCTKLNQIGCNLVIYCDYIYSNLLNTFEMINLHIITAQLWCYETCSSILLKDWLYLSHFVLGVSNYLLPDTYLLVILGSI